MQLVELVLDRLLDCGSDVGWIRPDCPGQGVYSRSLRCNKGLKLGDFVAGLDDTVQDVTTVKTGLQYKCLLRTFLDAIP